MKFFRGLLFALPISILMIFAFAQWSEATTRYTNGSCTYNGNGTALTCAAGAGQAGAYNSLANAQTGASTDDIVEISGGASGQSYVGLQVTKRLTWKASTQANYNGAVTIAYSAGVGSAIYNSVDGSIFQNLILTGGAGGWTFRSANNFTGSYLVVTSGSNGHCTYFSAGSSTLDHSSMTVASTATGRYGLWNEGTLTVSYSQISSLAAAGYGIYTTSATASTILYNSPINTPFSYPIYVGHASAQVILRNSEVLTSQYGFLMVSGATVNTDYSLIQSQFIYPDRFKGTNGTWTAGDHGLVNKFPWHKGFARGMGYITLTFDAWADIATYWTVKANYAMNTYGVPTTIDLPETENIGSANKATCQTLWKAGHGIGSHGRRSSQNADEVHAMTVNPGGSPVSFVVSGSGTILNVTGQSQIDLTSSPNNTFTGLRTTMLGWGYTVVLTLEGSTPTTVLADGTTSLPASTATYVPFDPTRFVLDQVTGSATDLETAMHEDAGCSAYLCKSMSWPGDAVTTNILTAAAANMGTSLKALRWSTGFWTTTEYKGPSDLSNQYIYAASMCHTAERLKGVGGDYDGLTTAQKKDRIEQGARNLVLWAAQGYWVNILHHYTSLTDTEFQWMLDEIVKYTSTYNIKIKTFDGVIDDILNSGSWSTTGNGYYTRTFTGTDDYHLLSMSPLINAGVDVGLTSDYEGKHVPMASFPDIGAYEYSGSNALFFAM